MSNESFINSIEEITGMGIDAEQRAKLLNLLYQYDADKKAEVCRASTAMISDIIELGFSMGAR